MAKTSSSKIVISLGGSLIAPPSGIDKEFILKFRSLIARHVRNGRRFVVVCGGGATARAYQQAAALLARPSREELDIIGIQATILNARLIRAVFGRLASRDIVTDPRVTLPRTAPVIIGAGWLPGCSSDNDAVLLARQFKAGSLINFSNIPYVYDKDPRRHPGAKPLHRLTWREYRHRFGGRWDPGLNSPFDPVAARAAERQGLSVIIADGRDLSNIDKIISGKPFRGTVIG